MKKRIILTVLAVLACLGGMALYIFSHRWQPATCTEPKTCSDCGATKGEPLPHNWQAATCTAPKTCIDCGVTQGEALPHNWGSTSCDAPAPCTECGTLEGIELTHQWSEKGRLCLVCGLDERPTDVRFVDYLGRSLDAKWSHMGIKPWYSVKSKEIWDAIVNAEYELLKEFMDADFEDERLGELAAQYIDTILKTRDALVNFGEEQWVDEYYNNIRHTQNIILYEINCTYPIEVKSENTGRLNELLVGGEEVDLINVMTDSIRFHYLTGGNQYEAIIENTTEFDFASVTYTVEFYDQNGNVIDTKTFELSPWKAGEKETFRFTLGDKSWGEQVVKIEWER